MTTTLDILRIALLITLPITLLAVLFKRYKRRVMMRDLPAPAHAELIGLEVAYHPSRVKAWVKIPNAAAAAPDEPIIRTTMLDRRHMVLHQWPEQRLPSGEHWIERPIEGCADGEYYFQLGTATQRTVRLFRLQQTSPIHLHT